MTRKLFIYLLLPLISVLYSSCQNGATETVNPKVKVSANFDVSVRKEFQNTIYPSMIFGLNEIESQTGSTTDYFTITVQPNVQTDIKIVIEESKLNFETQLNFSNVSATKTIIPSLKWKYDDMKQFSQPGIYDVTFVCYDGENKEIGRKNLKLKYRAINECVFLAVFDEKPVPFQFMFAAYVNEDSPVIDKFLQDVLKTTNLIDSFSGYQAGADEVDRQVAAMFYTLRAKGVKYSSITNTSNNNNYLRSQYVRFSDEVLGNTQANCVDGTAFFCSALQKIGIHSELVLVPGHMFLAYYIDAAQTKKRVLETTAVGNSNFSFGDAIRYQINNYNENVNKLNNDNYLDGYALINIPASRRIIKPIGR